MNRETTVCFTGHRTIGQKERTQLTARLYSSVTRLVLEGFDTFICGGAVGFDTEAARCVLTLRERFPSLRLVLALPCRDQTVKWESLEALSTYKEILGKADEAVYMQDFYSAGCMHERNRWMVDNSSVCVAYLTNRRGGTFYTYNYAEKKGLRTVNLAESDKNNIL